MYFNDLKNVNYVRFVQAEYFNEKLHEKGASV